MRIVSQNGNFDFEYEQIFVSIEEKFIFGGCYFDFSKKNILAEYSTKENAEKAMVILRETYKESLYTERIYDSNAQVIFPYINRSNSVFKFPLDDEIESLYGLVVTFCKKNGNG